VGNNSWKISAHAPEQIYMGEIKTAIDECVENRFRMIQILTALDHIIGNVFVELYDKGYRNGDFVVFYYDILYLIEKMREPNPEMYTKSIEFVHNGIAPMM
jgi:hypothetical protein